MEEKKRIKSFRDLEVYQLAYKLSKEIHELSLTFPKFELYELGSQIRRSSHSVPSCIAEGWGRRTDGQFRQFLIYAAASIDETNVHLNAAFDYKYISVERSGYFVEQYEILGKKIYNLIATLEKR